MCFQLKNHKPLHAKIIEHKVNIEIVKVCGYMLLPLYKGKTTTEFKNELLKIINKGLLQF